MLYAAQQVEELQDYIDNSSDPALQRWWAHFCEANDLLSEAIEYYIAVCQPLFFPTCHFNIRLFY